MSKESAHCAGRLIERIIVDECLGLDSPLLAKLTEQLGHQPVALVFVASSHPGIPDVEILDKLLDGRTALLPRDRAQRDYRSRIPVFHTVPRRLFDQW
jgi:hypothetical protein